MSEKQGEVENPKEAAGRAKLQLQLVPPAAKREMTLALEIGAAKYGAWNWRTAGINLMTYIGAMQRHLDELHRGRSMDPESGVSHIGHILAGAAIVADALYVGKMNDDRPNADYGPPVTAQNDLALQLLESMRAKGLNRYGINGALD
jgi:hypothetical protein